RLLVAPLQVRDHALERRFVPARVAVLVLVSEADLLVACAVQQHLALLLAQALPRFLHVDAEVLAHRLEELRVEELRLAPRRDRGSGPTWILSTTTCTSCFLLRSIGICSPISYRFPSTRTRTKPDLRTSSISERYSPFRPLTTGPSTMTRVPLGSFSTWSAICSTVWRRTSRPQTGQCGWP